MGVLRTRNASLYAHSSKAFTNPRDGTFPAHLPNSWTLSSADCGSHFKNNPAYKPVRPRPQSAMAKVLANPPNHVGRLSSEACGYFTGIQPAVRLRPASDVTIQLRNPAIRDGSVSSESIGLHTGVPPRKTADPRERTHLPKTRTGRPQSAPLWTRTMRASDTIGHHPAPAPPDLNDAAVMHFEAQFAHRFGTKDVDMGAVLSSGEHTLVAAAFQQNWIKRAEALNKAGEVAVDLTEGKSKRVDGELMEKMTFDAVYSNKHSHKDNESAIGLDLVPVVDPRRDRTTRPKKHAYGRMHQISTAYGLRQPLPSRATMGIGEGPGRATDF